MGQAAEQARRLSQAAPPELSHLFIAPCERSGRKFFAVRPAQLDHAITRAQSDKYQLCTLILALSCTQSDAIYMP